MDFVVPFSMESSSLDQDAAEVTMNCKYDNGKQLKAKQNDYSLPSHDRLQMESENSQET